MTTPFQKPELDRAAAPCWLVRQVGSAVEIVHVGPITPDVVSAIDRLAALFPKACALAGDVPDSCVGVRLEDSDQDLSWRTMLGLGEENSKIGSAPILLAVNRIQYVALARATGIK